MKSRPERSAANHRCWPFSTLSKKRNQIYFVPNFDNTNGYYSSDANWWNYWGKTVDGLFTWETVWPSAAGVCALAGATAPNVRPPANVAPCLRSSLRSSRFEPIGRSFANEGCRTTACRGREYTPGAPWEV